MSLRKLRLVDGNLVCPTCGKPLEYKVGDAAAAVHGGSLNMDRMQSRYECSTCKVYYRELLLSGYYDSYPLEDHDEPEAASAPHAATAGPVSLYPNEVGVYECPKCFGALRVVEGGPVRVVDGKVDMENTKPRYECDHCGVFYREILQSGYYLPYPQGVEDRPAPKPKAQPPAAASAEPPKRKVVSTGDLAPMILKRDANNQCDCPRCGAKMDYVEGQPVRIVDGKPDMDNVWDHFRCEECDSVFRRIVHTDYFQWTEK